MTTTQTKPDCSHLFPTMLDAKCGAKICIWCGYHKDMVACYCGWSLIGLDGKQYLQDRGEDID